MQHLQAHFVTNLRKLQCFLGIEVANYGESIYLLQIKYAIPEKKERKRRREAHRLPLSPMERKKRREDGNEQKLNGNCSRQAEASFHQASAIAQCYFHYSLLLLSPLLTSTSLLPLLHRFHPKHGLVFQTLG